VHGVVFSASLKLERTGQSDIYTSFHRLKKRNLASLTCLGPQQSRASTPGAHYGGDAADAAAVGALGVSLHY